MTQIKLVCKQCNNEFYTPLTRYNYLKKKNNSKNFYCSKLCFYSFNSPKPTEKICKYCKKSFTTTTTKSCCSISCSSKYSHSFSDPKNVSNSMIEFWKNKVHNRKVYKEKNCIVCKKIFQTKYNTKCCSNECSKIRIKIGALHSVQIQKENRRSKNEIYFSKLCNENFSNVITNEPMFNGWDADVILLNEKIAVLWNGNWHHKKITKKHSVKQVQNRDKIKLKEITKLEFLPYVINDYGKCNTEFVHEEFEKFIKWLDTRSVL